MNEFPISIAPKRKSKLNSVLNVILVIVIVVLILEVAFYTRFSRVYVVGSSMLNTLTGAESKDCAGGDFIYIDKYATPKYGDIIVIDPQGGETGSNYPRDYIVKRLIGLGGDTIKIDDGILYRNGEAVDEPYVDASNKVNIISRYFAEITVPEGKMFFLGDNRDNSSDSRYEKYGMLEVTQIVGVVTEWSRKGKSYITAINTFFEFTLPEWFSGSKT